MKNPPTIPNLLNIVLLLCSSLGAIVLLKLTSYSTSWPLTLLFVLLFSFVNNTNFSLLHESVHGLLNNNKRINTILGIYLSAFFPTGYHLQKYAHLSHHMNNRTCHEQFDYIREGDNKFVRYFQWYGILTGLYWLLPPISSLLYLFFSNRLKKIAISQRYANIANNTGATAMIKMIEKAPIKLLRLEIIYSIAFQFFILYFLDINFSSWLLCYGAFGINWSSLQYADHAWSELDTVNGAWNLRVHPFIRWCFLNYHCHHAHHKYTQVSWLYLPKFMDKNLPRPSFWKIYCLMWFGPKLMSEHKNMHNKILSTCC